METADDLDGVDFKPFFDMVVGVLFIRLILIAAQLFFSQFQDQSESAARENIKREWREEVSGFLDRFQRGLGERGMAARIDREHIALAMPLSAFAGAGDDGFPRIASGPMLALGRALGESMGCVGKTAGKSADCPAQHLLHGDQVRIKLRHSATPERPGLPQERYGRLLESLFGAALLRATPDLLRQSGSDCAIALHIASSISAAVADPAAPGALGGDLIVNFKFVPPMDGGAIK